MKTVVVTALIIIAAKCDAMAQKYKIEKTGNWIRISRYDWRDKIDNTIQISSIGWIYVAENLHGGNPGITIHCGGEKIQLTYTSEEFGDFQADVNMLSKLLNVNLR